MELGPKSLGSSTQESALDGGRHIGEHQTKNNIVTIGFPRHRNLGVAWKSVLFQWMSTQRNLEEPIEQCFLAQATNPAKYSVLNVNDVQANKLNASASFPRLSCKTFKSTPNSICFVSLSVCPSVSLPPSLSFSDTHLFQIPFNTDSSRFLTPQRTAFIRPYGAFASL